MKRYIQATDNSDNIFDPDYISRARAAEAVDDLDILEVFANDPNPIVRLGVAKNPNTPSYILTMLAHEPRAAFSWSGKIWAEVACHPNTSDADLLYLSLCGISGVAEDLVKNPNIPHQAMLNVLDLYPNNINVVRHALYNPNLTEDILSRIIDVAMDIPFGGEEILTAALNSPALTSELLDQMISYGNIKLWTKIISHKLATPDILRRLSQLPDDRIRFWLALNPKTPPDILTEISTSNSKNVRKNLISNPNTPDDVRARLISELQ